MRWGNLRPRTPGQRWNDEFHAGWDDPRFDVPSSGEPGPIGFPNFGIQALSPRPGLSPLVLEPVFGIAGPRRDWLGRIVVPKPTDARIMPEISNVPIEGAPSGRMEALAQQPFAVGDPAFMRTPVGVETADRTRSAWGVIMRQRLGIASSVFIGG